VTIGVQPRNKKAAAIALRPKTRSRDSRERSAICYLSSSPPEDDGLELWLPECPHDGAGLDGAGLDGAGLGAAQLGADGAAAGAGLRARAGFGASVAATAGAAFFFADAFLALAFLADFFGAALDFLADFFADFLAFFTDFLADFLEVFFEVFFFAVRSFFLFFLSFLLFLLFFPLAIVILLFAAGPCPSSVSSRPLSRGANRSVQSWPGTACRPIEKLNRVNHRN
jgi:hypothetical protein